MQAPTTRPSNVAGMIRPGENSYVDQPGDEPQRVHVEYEDGIPWVTFLAVEDEDAGLMVDGRTLVGSFTRVL